MSEKINRSLVLEIVRVTERAAVACAPGLDAGTKKPLTKLRLMPCVGN